MGLRATLRQHPNASRAILAIGDVLALLLFIYIGQRDHNTLDAASPVRGLLLPALIFAVPWLIAGWLLAAFPRSSEVSWRTVLGRGLVTWLVAAPLALLLRAYLLDRAMISRAFIAATYGFGGALILGWRLVFALAWGRRESGARIQPGPGPRDTARSGGERQTDVVVITEGGQPRMFNPYYLMAILFTSLAVLGALDNALSLFDIMPAYAGMAWLRVHFITLGALTEVVFGVIPGLVARYRGEAAPRVRWDIWLALTAGILTLMIGMPLINAALIITGGTLIFIAAAMLMNTLANTGGDASRQPNRGRPFYIAGLGYLLVGIIVGTGLFLGWGETLRIAVPKEVHIHANSWGFMALIFAGLLVDMYPEFTGKQLAWPRSIEPIFWLIVVGELGLVLGPWVGTSVLTVPGMLLHAAGTIWLLLNVIKPMAGERWSVGMWHLVTSYFWFFAPMLVATFIVAQVPGFPGGRIEANAPQALIYGWVLQFGYALMPYIVSRVVRPDEAAALGGNWFSLIAVHAGGFLFWAGIFFTDYQALLQATAYTLWVLSLLPILVDLWEMVQVAVKHEPAAPPVEDPSAAD